MLKNTTCLASACMALSIPAINPIPHAAEVIRKLDPWPRHVVAQGFHSNTAVGADFTGDGQIDVISSGNGSVRLFVAPDWKEVILHKGPSQGWNCIHSEVLDVDGDGDPDYIGAIPDHDVFWL